MKRKFISACIAAFLTLSLIACEEDPGEDIHLSSSTTQQSTTEQTSEQSASEVNTTEATTEATTEPTTEETTTTTETTTEATTILTVESDMTAPDAEGEPLEELEDAIVQMVVSEELNGEDHSGVLTPDAPFHALEEIETYRIDDAYYLKAYVVLYEPLVDEADYYVGMTSVNDHGIGYYSFLGEDEELSEYRLHDTEGLDQQIFRLRQRDGDGDFYIDGRGLLPGTAEVLDLLEEFPLVREGGLQEVYTESGLTLNLRDLPSLEGETLASLAVGTPLYTIDFNEAKFILAVPEGREYFGFVSRDFVRDIDDEANVESAADDTENADDGSDTDDSDGD